MLSAPPGSPHAWPRLGSEPSRGRQRARRARRQTLLAWAHLHASLKPNLRRSDCPQGSALPGPAPGADRCRDLERGSRSARRQYEPPSIQKQCSRTELTGGLAGRCPMLVASALLHHTPSRKGGAIAITSLPRRSPEPERISGKAGPVCPQLRKCHVRPGSYASCHKRK